MIRGAAILAALALAGCATTAPAPTSGPRAFHVARDWSPAPLPRVFDAAAAADAVFVGEEHDDEAGHAFELSLLQALAARGRPVVLAMEMFERDVQPAIYDYLAGRIDEAAMLARTRPWPNYAAAYRPLVEFARAQGWPVVAGNAPRPLAARIAAEGPRLLDRLEPAERALLAAEMQCPEDAYRARFAAEFTQAMAHGPLDAAAVERAYQAQCAKDETMAEATAAHMRPGLTVVHVNGAFHSDGRLGVAARTARRKPVARILVLSVRSGDEARPSPAAADLRQAYDAQIADYLILTR